MQKSWQTLIELVFFLFLLEGIQLYEKYDKDEKPFGRNNIQRFQT